jgi:hypothetical protein
MMALTASGAALTRRLSETPLGFFNFGFRYAVAACPLLGGGFPVQFYGLANRRTGYAA